MMIFLSSPAKTFSDHAFRELADARYESTMPPFQSDAAELVKQLRVLSGTELKSHLGVSDTLAELNSKRYQQFDLFGKQHAHPALLMYRGDVFRQLEVPAYSDSQLMYAYTHVLILSGLYGIVRASDLIQEYRLEMKLRTLDSEMRYGMFWKERVTGWLETAYDKRTTLVVHLESKEYMSAIDTKSLSLPQVIIRFEQQRGGEFKQRGILAKQARGAFIDYCVQHEVVSREQLSDFDRLGYRLYDTDAEYLVFRSKDH